MKDAIFSLNVIKSIKILKCIFNHLRNNKKLILLNYNKSLQNKLGFTIDDYKQNAKRIKIGGLNGYGKEFSLTYKLIFEGNYLNGKRNGKGIEYFENERIKFEGEYLNGEIFNGIRYDEKGNEVLRINNGIVKELYDNGLVKFEGKYLNGKKWNGVGYTYLGIKIYEINNGCGYIREYNPDGTLLFKGNYLNGERNGDGKEYLYGKLLFEGNYKNGVRNGEGKEYYDNLRIQFEGEYLDGKRWNGIVYYYNGNKKYEIKEGKEEEEEITNINNTFYNVGKSTIEILLERLKERQIIFKKKVRKERKSVKNFLNGNAKKEKFNKIVKFEGKYINGKLNGKGKQYFWDELIFEGEYMDGKKNGFGTEYYNNGKIKFEGEYQDGKINGKGKEYDYFGRLIFEGEYVNNKRIKDIIYKYNNNNKITNNVCLIPKRFFSQYENKVPIDKIKKYHNKYHIKSSILKSLNSKRNKKKEKLKFDKKNNKWKRSKKCRWSINIWR